MCARMRVHGRRNEVQPRTADPRFCRAVHALISLVAHSVNRQLSMNTCMSSFALACGREAAALATLAAKKVQRYVAR